MKQIRMLVGTRKGAFILTSDHHRKDWKVEGPYFAGWEIFHINASPVNPDRLYASQSLSWFGQVVQRSDDGGKTWNPVGNDFRYEGDPGTHQWFDGTQKPWQFKRIWQIQPSLTDPETVFAGAEDAALFKSTDGGHDLAGTIKTSRSTGQPLATRGGGNGAAYHSAGSSQPETDRHCHLCRRSVPNG